MIFVYIYEKVDHRKKIEKGIEAYVSTVFFVIETQALCTVLLLRGRQ